MSCRHVYRWSKCVCFTYIALNPQCEYLDGNLLQLQNFKGGRPPNFNMRDIRINLRRLRPSSQLNLIQQQRFQWRHVQFRYAILQVFADTIYRLNDAVCNVRIVGLAYMNVLGQQKLKKKNKPTDSISVTCGAIW